MNTSNQPFIKTLPSESDKKHVYGTGASGELSTAKKVGISAVVVLGAAAIGGGAVGGVEYINGQRAEAHAVSELHAAPFGKHRIVHLGDKIKMSNGKIVELSDLTTVVDNSGIPHLSETAGVDALTEQLKIRGIDTQQTLPAGLEIDLTPDAQIGDMVTPE